MLPSDDKQRKLIRAFTAFVKYFPDAIAACANLSRHSNEQHNPGTEVHWDKSKSQDELDSLMNHVLDIGSKGPESRDADGVLDAVKVGWRALANIQRLADKGVDVITIPEPDLINPNRHMEADEKIENLLNVEAGADGRMYKTRPADEINLRELKPGPMQIVREEPDDWTLFARVILGTHLAVPDLDGQIVAVFQDGPNYAIHGGFPNVKEAEDFLRDRYRHVEGYRSVHVL